MVNFPTHPRYARMLLAAEELGCVRAAALLAALTQARPLLLRTDRKTEEERRDLFGGGQSDFLVMTRVFAWAKRHDFRTTHCRRFAIHADAARQVGRLFEQFSALASSQGLTIEAPPASDETIAKCILIGFADHVARRRSAGTNLCDIVHGRRGLLTKDSAAASSRLLVAADISEIGQSHGDARVQLSMATALDESMLRELFPKDFHDKKEFFFDTATNRVVWRTEKVFRDLVIESIHRDASPCPEASDVLAETLAEGDLPLPTWKDDVTAWTNRLEWLAHHHPELHFPTLTEEVHLSALKRWCKDAISYREVKDRPALPALEKMLSKEQRATLSKMAPLSYELPSKKKAKLRYQPTGEVILTASIQDLFGLKKAPHLGKHQVTMEILAPNRRPIQKTRDLASFWNTTYPKIKAELARRYPKHSWQ